MSEANVPMPVWFLKISRKVPGSNGICHEAIGTGPSLGGSKSKLAGAGVTEVIVTDGPRKQVPGPFAVLAVAASGAESIDWRRKAQNFPAQNAPSNRQKSP
jgi:hypothetical protein